MRRCSKFVEFRWGYSAELARKREGTRIGTVHGKRHTSVVIKMYARIAQLARSRPSVRRHTNEQLSSIRRPSVSDDEGGHIRHN